MPAAAPRNDAATLPTVPITCIRCCPCCAACRCWKRSGAPAKVSWQRRHAGTWCGERLLQNRHCTTTQVWHCTHFCAPHSLTVRHFGQGITLSWVEVCCALANTVPQNLQ